MYTVDLHQTGETRTTAVYNLKEQIRLAKKGKEKIMSVIVGYGSTGGTHKIKTAVLEELENLYSHKQIKGYILDSEIDIFNTKYQTLCNKELIPKEYHIKKNAGEIFIIL